MFNWLPDTDLKPKIGILMIVHLCTNDGLRSKCGDLVDGDDEILLYLCNPSFEEVSSRLLLAMMSSTISENNALANFFKMGAFKCSL